MCFFSDVDKLKGEKVIWKIEDSITGTIILVDEAILVDGTISIMVLKRSTRQSVQHVRKNVKCLSNLLKAEMFFVRIVLRRITLEIRIV